MSIIEIVSAFGNFFLNFLGSFIVTEFFIIPVLSAVFLVCVILPLRAWSKS